MMKATVFIVLAILAISQASVIELTDSNFEELTKEGKWLLEFYAPWCQHCQSLEPVLKRAADTIGQRHPELKVGSIDCTVQKTLADRFKIQGYPTLKYYRDEYATNYEYGRSYNDFLKFAEKVTRPPVIKVSTEDEVTKVVNSEAVTFVLRSNDVKQLGVFSKIANKYHDSLAFVHLPTDQNTLTLVSDTKEEFKGLFELDSVEKWVLERRLPVFCSIDGNKWPILTQRKKKIVVTALDEQNPTSAKFSSMIKEIALENSEYSFGHMDVSEYSKFIGHYLPLPGIPHIFIIDPVSHNYWNNVSIPREKNAISQFLKDIEEGKIPSTGGSSVFQKIVKMASDFVETAVSNPLYSGVLILSVVVLLGGAIYITLTGTTKEELKEDDQEGKEKKD